MNKFWIALILVASTVFCFIDSADRELISDDICYQFIFEDDAAFMNVDRMRPVDSVSDIFGSLGYHYMNVNGRMLPHFFVQYFDSIGGKWLFAACNSIIFLLFILFLTHYSLRACMRAQVSAWWYLLVVLAMFYLFPVLDSGVIWFSPAFSLNYLWGGFLFVLFLNFFESHKTHIALIVLFALLVGLQNEGFSIPLCGGLFIYLLINRKSVSRRLVLIPAVLILATAVTALAPGTIGRALSGESNGRGLSGILLGTVECYCAVKIFWIYLVSLLLTLLIKGRRYLGRYLRENSLFALVFGVAVLFSVYAHSGKHSLTGVEIMSLILLVRLFKTLIVGSERRLRVGKMAQNVMLGCFIGLFIASQSLIAVANSRTRDEYKRMEMIYDKSPDGVTYMSHPEIRGLAGPTVVTYKRYMTPSHYTASKFAYLHNQTEKKLPLILSPADYRNLIERPDSFFTARKPVPGSAHAYECENMYVVPMSGIAAEASEDSGMEFMACFDDDSYLVSLPWHRRLVHRLLGSRKAAKPLGYEVVETRHGRYILIEKILSTPSRIERE